jgi:transposase-like protein
MMLRPVLEWLAILAAFRPLLMASQAPLGADCRVICASNLARRVQPVRLRLVEIARHNRGCGAYRWRLVRLPDSQWRSARTTNAIERLHEEFKRRIKTQRLLPCCSGHCLHAVRSPCAKWTDGKPHANQNERLANAV